MKIIRSQMFLINMTIFYRHCNTTVRSRNNYRVLDQSFEGFDLNGNAFDSFSCYRRFEYTSKSFIALNTYCLTIKSLITPLRARSKCEPSQYTFPQCSQM